MDIVQIIMLVTAGAVVFMIYKQIDSGNFQQVHKDKQDNQPRPQQQESVQKPSRENINTSSKKDRINDLLSKTDTFVNEGNFTEAKKSIEAALILQENSDNLMRQGFILQNLSEHTEAIEVFKKVTELENENDMAYLFLAQSYTQIKDYDNAKTAFENALNIDNEYEKTHIEYAKMLIEIENTEQAKQHLNKALSISPQNSEAQTLLEKLEKGDKDEEN